MPSTYPTGDRPHAGAQRDLPVVADLATEQRSFARLLARLAPADYERPSAAPGWTIRDQVAHLADTEEVAADTILGGPRAFRRSVSAFPTAEAFTAAGCRRGRDMATAELTAWWQDAAATTLSLLRDMAPDRRVDWGFGMAARTLAAARLMEHWAHRLDITESLGLPVVVSGRLWHVADLALQTLPYALARARVRRPVDRTLRLELTEPSGAGPVLGPPDATDVLRGPLLAWCRVAVRRPAPADRSRLTATGPLAESALTHARAYL